MLTAGRTPCSWKMLLPPHLRGRWPHPLLHHHHHPPGWDLPATPCISIALTLPSCHHTPGQTPSVPLGAPLPPAPVRCPHDMVIAPGRLLSASPVSREPCGWHPVCAVCHETQLCSSVPQEPLCCVKTYEEGACWEGKRLAVAAHVSWDMVSGVLLLGRAKLSPGLSRMLGLPGTPGLAGHLIT